MDDLKIKLRLTHDCTITFCDDESDNPFICFNHSRTCDEILRVWSYKEYLTIINTAEVNWNLETHNVVYQWMRKMKWL